MSFATVDKPRCTLQLASGFDVEVFAPAEMVLTKKMKAFVVCQISERRREEQISIH